MGAAIVEKTSLRASLTTEPRKGIDGLGTTISEKYRVRKPTQESTDMLNKCLMKNTEIYSIMFHNKMFHNHTPHALISAYYLGADATQLEAFYNVDTVKLVKWHDDSPNEINDSTWQEYLTKKDYDNGYYKFFKAKIEEAVANGGKWQDVAKKYIHHPGKNLFNSLVGGLAHPVIHLGYAVEIDSPIVAAEALALAAVDGVETDHFVRETRKDIPTNSDPLEILAEIREDKTFDGVADRPVHFRLVKFLERFPERAKYYIHRLKLEGDLETQLKTMLQATASVFGATHKDGEPDYDFFLLHLLTSTMETAEIMLNLIARELIPESAHEHMLQYLWTVCVYVYINQLRPRVDPSRVTSVTIESIPHAWNEAVFIAVGERGHHDEHLVKAIRALLFAESVTKDTTGYYARIAYSFAHRYSQVDSYVGRPSSTRFLDVKL
ncbi:hypothetical protein TRVA0_027S00980 [Trichomonascus vanleenenianus]|uniref:questin oxidase family protein n=1 Tax=Trichomonascus vanleenenianus TaxID=2268995 RepID=UPI003ECA8D5A